jgi:hypothetical protein
MRDIVMRRTFFFSLFALLAAGAAHPAAAQHRGGGGFGFAHRGGSGFSRARAASRYGFGYAYLPNDFNDAYPYAADSAVPDSVVFVQQPQQPVEPPAPPTAWPAGHAVITEYTWPAASAAPAPPSEPAAFGIVLKNGSTLSAVMVFASDDGLHYVDSDERHLTVSMSQVDRAATLALNRARNLNLYLPSGE